MPTPPTVAGKTDRDFYPRAAELAQDARSSDNAAAAIATALAEAYNAGWIDADTAADSDGALAAVDVQRLRTALGTLPFGSLVDRRPYDATDLVGWVEQLARVLTVHAEEDRDRDADLRTLQNQRRQVRDFLGL